MVIHHSIPVFQPISQALDDSFQILTDSSHVPQGWRVWFPRKLLQLVFSVLACLQPPVVKAVGQLIIASVHGHAQPKFPELVEPVVILQMCCHMFKVLHSVLWALGVVDSGIGCWRWQCGIPEEQGLIDINVDSPMIADYVCTKCFIPCSLDCRHESWIDEYVINATCAVDVSIEVGASMEFKHWVHQSTVIAQFSHSDGIMPQGFIEVTGQYNQLSLSLALFYKVGDVPGVMPPESVRVVSVILFMHGVLLCDCSGWS